MGDKSEVWLGTLSLMVLSTLQLYELETLLQYALHRAFEPVKVVMPTHLPAQTATAESAHRNVQSAVSY